MKHTSLFLFLMACSTSEEGLKVYNSEPTAAITSHSEGAELFEAIEYTFMGTVTDPNHSALELNVKWSTDTRELCAETTPDADGSASCRGTLEEGDTQLKFQVVDPEGATAISSINIT